jgi:hypothetical protein
LPDLKVKTLVAAEISETALPFPVDIVVNENASTFLRQATTVGYSCKQGVGKAQVCICLVDKQGLVDLLRH